MSSTVTSRVIAIAAAALLACAPGIGGAAPADARTALVAQLYKDFAWQAFADQQDLFGDDVSHQTKATLEKYFDPALSTLLLQDAQCQLKQHGICNLEFDLLFDSQDPSVIDLEVALLAADKVAVKFKNAANGIPTKIEFKLARVAGHWKITDIRYGDMRGTSLKKILMRKIP